MMKFVFQVILVFSCQLFSIQTGPLQIFAESNRIIKEKCVLAFPEFFLKDWNAVGGLHKKGIFCHCEMASNRVVAVCGKSKVIVCKFFGELSLLKYVPVYTVFTPYFLK